MGIIIIIQPIGENIMLKNHPNCQDDLKKTLFEKGCAMTTGEQAPEDIFAITEIKIEEISIDGICGVY